jgi:hypothetical protein
MAISPLDQTLAFSFVWLVFCALGYYALLQSEGPTWETAGGRSLRVVAMIFVVALLVRLVPAIVLPRGAEYDIESCRRVAEVFLRGEAVYSSPVVAGRHPYLPFHLYVIGGAAKFSEVMGVPFVLAIKLVPILADAALAVLIFCAVCQLGRPSSRALVWSLLYALNPIAILVSAYHGQFDAETVFLLTLSWYVWRFGGSSTTRLNLSAVLLGFAVLSKTWPLLFLPILWLRLESRRQRVTYVLMTLAVPVVFTLFYVTVFHQDPHPLLRRALTHSGVPGWWGGGAIVNLVHHIAGMGAGLLTWLAKYGRWLVFVGAAFAYWMTRRATAISALTTLLVVLFVLTSGFGLQWTLWVVPFALLAGDSWGSKWYTLGALVYMLPAYYGYHFEPLLLRWMSPDEMAMILLASAIPVWVLSVRWALRRLRLEGAGRPEVTVVSPGLPSG